jgi:hypothetical protein
MLLVGDATVTCRTRPALVPQDLEGGNVQVRDGA